MPYLSKIPINPLRRGAQRLLRSPQALHAAVLGGLATQPVAERVLWRDERDGPACHLLVLTQSQPSWEHLVEQAGWAGSPSGGALTRDLRPLLDLIVKGREFSFRVRANPTQSLKKPEHPTASQQRVSEDRARTRGTRVGHRTIEHQLRWFVEQGGGPASRWGFTVNEDGISSVNLLEREHISFSKGQGSHRVTLDRVTYGGTLTVVEPDRVRQVVLGGLGGAKAYGCGLLTLAPVTR